MTHVGVPTIASNNQSLPNQPFFAWLRTQTALFVGQMLVLIGAVYSIVALVYYISGLHVPTGIITPKTIGTIVIYSHLFFLTVFIVWLIKILNENHRGAYRASRVYERLVEQVSAGDSLSEKEHTRFADTCAEQVGTFKRWFLGFWCAMLFLYMVFAVQPKYNEFYPPSGPDSLVVQRLNDRLRDGKAVKLTPGEQDELSKAGRLLTPDERRQTLIFPFLAFMANNVSLFFIFGCFVALYLPARQKSPMQPSEDLPKTANPLIDEARAHRGRQQKLWLCFGGLLVLFTLAFPGILWIKSVELTTNNWSEYVAVFDALSGTLNAVVVALMIARLDSKLIGLPPWLISILYFYSGVQPLFVVFDQPVDVFGTIRTAVLIVVFIFKVYFFLIILYSLQNGRLFNYFYCSYLLNKQVNGMVSNGETIRTGSSALYKAKELIKSLLPASEPIKARVLSLQKRLPVLRPLLDRGSRLVVSSRLYVHWMLTRVPGAIALRNAFNKMKMSVQHRERQLTVAAILGWLGMIYFVGSLLYYAGRIGSKQSPFAFSSLAGYLLVLANLVTLSVIIVVLRKAHKNNHYKSNRAAESIGRTIFPRDSELAKKTPNLVRRFRRYFLMFWLAMFAFYVAFAFQQYLDDIGALIPPNITSTLQEALVISDTNIRDSRELPKRRSDSAKLGKTAHGEDKVISDRQNPPRILESPLPRGVVARSLTYSWVAFLMNNLMALFLFLCFTILYVSAEDRRVDVKLASLRNYSILICTLLTMSFPLLLVFIEKSSLTKTNVTALATVFAAVGGILNAVALALLIARLDSRLIRLPTSVVSVLYSYSALQTLFVVFAPEGRVFSAIETSSLVTALILKICLVLIVTHAWQSDRFEDYLVYFPFLNKRVNSIFDNQFEIRSYSTGRRFKYSIFKENVEKYKTEESYRTRIECDDAVGIVREAMSNCASYGDRPLSVHGTYWIQVKNLDKDKEKVICESTSLRSEAEARELIDESIEMVPYCKYDRG